MPRARAIWKLVSRGQMSRSESAAILGPDTALSSSSSSTISPLSIVVPGSYSQVMQYVVLFRHGCSHVALSDPQPVTPHISGDSSYTDAAATPLEYMN